MGLNKKMFCQVMRDVTEKSVDEAASERNKVKTARNSPCTPDKTAGEKSSSKLVLLKQFFRLKFFSSCCQVVGPAVN